MVWLGFAITIAILVTIGFPIGMGFWLNKKFHIPWRVLSYGVMGYLIMQSVVSLILSGISALVANGTLALSETGLTTLQLVLNIALAAILGVVIRWAIVKFFPEKLETLEAAFGIGVGYGGAESVMLVGLPLLVTFVTMLTHLDFQSASAGLEADMVSQLEALWGVSPLVPLAGSLERLAALVMHLTVTVLVFRYFLLQKKVYLLAAAGVELVFNGLVVGLSEAGLAYGWVILISVILMGGNLYLLWKLNAFSLKEFEAQPKLPEK
jgi:uncharacterized membrane protein YhfC